jgi:hypothetical protein
MPSGSEGWRLEKPPGMPGEGARLPYFSIAYTPELSHPDLAINEGSLGDGAEPRGKDREQHFNRVAHGRRTIMPVFPLLFSALLLPLWNCGRPSQVNSIQKPERINFNFVEEGEIWFRHSQIQLRFDSEMYCRVFFKKNSKVLSINDIPIDPTIAKPTHFIEVNGLELKDFRVDYRNIGVSDIKTQFGTGKRLQVTGYAKPSTAAQIRIEKNLNVELYEDLPDTALLWATYRNLSEAQAVEISKTVNDFFRLDAARANAGSPRYAFWIFRGGSDKAGSGKVQTIGENFSSTFGYRPVESGSDTIPFLDLWTTEMGMAIGDVSRAPPVLSSLVEVARDKRVEISIQSGIIKQLGPNESLITSKSFLMVHSGDYRTALQRYLEMTRL